MSESEPIQLRPRMAGDREMASAGKVSTGKVSTGKVSTGNSAPTANPPIASATLREYPSVVAFNRHELNDILAVYGRKVAEGEWRDYALDMSRDRAVFSVFRRTSECPLYRIEKTPRLARRQGAYSVVAATGLIMKRGNDLRRVLAVLDRSLRLVGR